MQDENEILQSKIKNYEKENDRLKKKHKSNFESLMRLLEKLERDIPDQRVEQDKLRAENTQLLSCILSQEVELEKLRNQNEKFLQKIEELEKCCEYVSIRKKTINI